MATKFITVSIEIMHDKQLSPNQKFILAEIQQLSSLEKGCIASNRHFSELIGITMSGVSKALSDLESKNYIIINNAQTKRNFGRVITIDSGKSPIDSGKSPIDSVQESKENKTINKTINIYDSFLEDLKSKVSIKSKVTKTKDGEKLFKQIEDKEQLAKDYIQHQLEKKEFAVRITPFMEDYQTVHSKQKKESSNDLGGWHE